MHRTDTLCSLVCSVYTCWCSEVCLRSDFCIYPLNKPHIRVLTVLMVLQSEWCGWIQPSFEGWPVDKSWSGAEDSGTSARVFVGAHNHRSLSLEDSASTHLLDNVAGYTFNMSLSNVYNN